MCANGMHEDEFGGSECPGQGPGCDDDDSVRCAGCDEPLRECACEEQTVETAALVLSAVSEAEAARREVRKQLVAALGRATAGESHAARLGRLVGGLEVVLSDLGMPWPEVGALATSVLTVERAAKGGAR